jgi:hypothetical protein
MKQFPEILNFFIIFLIFLPYSFIFLSYSFIFSFTFFHIPSYPHFILWERPWPKNRAPPLRPGTRGRGEGGEVKTKFHPMTSSSFGDFIVPLVTSTLSHDALTPRRRHHLSLSLSSVTLSSSSMTTSLNVKNFKIVKTSLLWKLRWTPALGKKVQERFRRETGLLIDVVLQGKM